jgi:hypothetical protein
MATTPNVGQEQQNKLNLRGVTRGGATPGMVTPPVDVAIMVNAAATTSGILELSVGTGTTTFTISGSNGVTTTLTGTATGTQVSGLISALAAGPLSNYTFYVNEGLSNYLYNTTTSIIVPSGVTLTVVSGTGAVPTLTAFALSGTEATTYPNYVGTPNAAPTWIDDATAHSYVVGFNGNILGGTILNASGIATTSGALVTQQQVRQILTGANVDGGSSDQRLNGYFASYSGNLYQTGQKRTQRQQN